MIKMFCDKCGKPIEGTTYYDISIVAKDIEPVSNYEACADTYAYNLSQGLLKALTKEKHYCEECKNKIEAFIANNETSMSNEASIPVELKQEFDKMGVSLTDKKGEYRSTKEIITDIARYWLSI